MLLSFALWMVVLENTWSFSVFALEELLHETLKDPQTEHLLKKPLCVCFQKEIQTALGCKWSWGLMTTCIYNVEAESCWHHRISTHAHRFPLISPQSVPLALFGTKDIWSIRLYKFHLWPVAAWRAACVWSHNVISPPTLQNQQDRLPAQQQPLWFSTEEWFTLEWTLSDPELKGQD